MSWETIILALIVIVGGVVTHFTNLWAKKADWRRQDELAARVEAVKAQAEKAAELLKASTDAQAQATADASEKLVAIDKTSKHTLSLVNSAHTASKQSDRDGTALQLISLHEVIRLQERLSERPNPATLEAIKTAEKKIESLDKELIILSRAAEEAAKTV